MARVRVERLRRIDVRHAHCPRLEPGGRLEVRIGGDPVAALPVVFTPCRFGGARPWLRCPSCRRRRIALFVHGAAVACRVCFGLRYRSQLQDAGTRLEERAERIQRSLGWEDGHRWIPRPKGMWRRTYQRRLGQAHALWNAASALEEEEAWRTGLRLLRKMPERGVT